MRHAAAAGYDVVTTSSPRNWAFVEKLGAVHVIDHTKPAAEIVAALKAHGPYDFVFDTIGFPPVTAILYEYLSSAGGGEYNTLIPLLSPQKPVPKNVNRKFAAYSQAFENEANADTARWFYDEYVPKGLKTGMIVPTRQEWVTGGLKRVQEVLDRMAENKVSGVKLIMNPWAN